MEKLLLDLESGFALLKKQILTCLCLMMPAEGAGDTWGRKKGVLILSTSSMSSGLFICFLCPAKGEGQLDTD